MSHNYFLSEEQKTENKQIIEGNINKKWLLWKERKEMPKKSNMQNITWNGKCKGIPCGPFCGQYGLRKGQKKVKMWCKMASKSD